jgi:CRISPR-associated protein Cas1
MRVNEDGLWLAWEGIRHGGKSAGPDGISLVDFRRRHVREIEALVEELRRDRYRPGLYRAVQVPKESGGRRILTVADVRDRVVQRWLHDRIAPLVEQVSLDCSFAYRPRRCHLDALERVAALRDAGFRHVLHSDVRNCFDEINLLLVAMLMQQAGIGDEPAQMILECLSAGFVGIPRPDDVHGLPQGAVLSPVLCNLVLTEFDRALQGRHRRLVRFADDFLVLCQSEAGCERALERAREALADLGLAVNEGKTQITSFEQGFRYLGAKVVRSFIIPEKRRPYHGMQHPSEPCRKHPRLDWVF